MSRVGNAHVWRGKGVSETRLLDIITFRERREAHVGLFLAQLYLLRTTAL